MTGSIKPANSWIIYGMVVLLWTFLANRLERWMNQKAFGVHLDHMKEIISQLEQEPELTTENSLYSIFLLIDDSTTAIPTTSLVKAIRVNTEKTQNTSASVNE